MMEKTGQSICECCKWENRKTDDICGLDDRRLESDDKIKSIFELLDDKLRQRIALNTVNQFVIIGRNPTGLLLAQDEIYELSHSKKGEITLFTLKRAF
jgi:hypothetical protein